MVIYIHMLVTDSISLGNNYMHGSVGILAEYVEAQNQSIRIVSRQPANTASGWVQRGSEFFFPY